MNDSSTTSPGYLIAGSLVPENAGTSRQFTVIEPDDPGGSPTFPDGPTNTDDPPPGGSIEIIGVQSTDYFF